MHRLVPTLTSVAAAALVVGTAARAAAQDPHAFFDSNCAPCHTIGGGAQGGPDLKGVTERRAHDWVVRFVLDPEGVVAAKDSAAQQMVKEADGMVMPVTPGMTPALAEALVTMIEQRSGAPAAPSAAAAPPEVTATEADVTLGAELFAGSRAFTRRGPACLSCHDVAGLQHLGGGTFGPDLTRVHRRLGGTRGLTGWLSAPPTPMMRATFRPAPLDPGEVRALTAYLERAASGSVEPPARPRGGALAAISLPFIAGALAVIGFAGRTRLMGVRRRLVASGGHR